MGNVELIPQSESSDMNNRDLRMSLQFLQGAVIFFTESVLPIDSLSFRLNFCCKFSVLGHVQFVLKVMTTSMGNVHCA